MGKIKLILLFLNMMVASIAFGEVLKSGSSTSNPFKLVDVGCCGYIILVNVLCDFPIKDPSKLNTT
jgi:hypothetical protein